MESVTTILQEWHVMGLATGLCTFLVIGLFHPICIKCEYYYGTRCWWWFLLLGIAMCAASVFVDDVFVATLCGVVGFSSFWTIKELFEQKERVRKGWFPMNPRRKNGYRD